MLVLAFRRILNIAHFNLVFYNVMNLIQKKQMMKTESDKQRCRYEWKPANIGLCTELRNEIKVLNNMVAGCVTWIVYKLLVVALLV